MQACHWKARNTLTIFYLKDLTWSDNDKNLYVGPVQFLDPSRQTSYPRKESLQESKSQGLGICLPHQDVWVRSFYFSVYIYIYCIMY